MTVRVRMDGVNLFPYANVWIVEPTSTTTRRRGGSSSVERLGPDDWVRAALGAIAEGGLANVSVERLATTLGATKGSFYWHFKDRPALLAAALARWEELYTDEIMERLAAVADPRERFRRLLTSAFQDSAAVRIDTNLLAAGDDPVVSVALARVAAKRLAFIERIFTELGTSGGPDRAVLAMSAYLGLAQLRRFSPRVVPRGKAAKAYIANATEWLLGDVDPR